MRSAALAAIVLFLVFSSHSAASASQKPAWRALRPAVEHLAQLSRQSSSSLDHELISALAAKLRTTPPGPIELPSFMSMHGAGLTFCIEADLEDVLRYGFNPQLPSSVTRPNSVRWARWKSRTFRADPPSRQLWKCLTTAEAPVVVQGIEREETSPDLSTGGYYVYDIKRSLILLPQRQRPIFISIAFQGDVSEIGCKGDIIGPDTDWSYFYSEEEGLNRFGLGWVESRLTKAFSVAVYQQTAPGTVRCSCLNWLRGGWKGLNVIRSKHILNGLKRFGRGASRVLESPRLPPHKVLAGWYQSLQQLARGALNARYSKHLKRLLKKPADSSLLEDFAPRIRSGKHARETPRPAKETELFIQRLKSTLAGPAQAKTSR